MSIDVLVVDDSALVRKFLTEIINTVDDINLVGTAFDPIYAIEKLKKNRVDVILLDIEMPRMDGLTFLEKLMKGKPTPVIILSSLTEKNAEISLRAIELGAFEVLQKPEDMMELPNMRKQLIEVIRGASRSNIKNKLISQYNKGRTQSKLPPPVKLFTATRSTTDKVIVVGSSTGGTTAIHDILSKLPIDLPGIVIVQHMPLRFSETFAKRLDNSLNLTVKLAKDGDRIQNGFVYIAPGEQHCEITVSGAKYLIKLKRGPRINYHKPSVEVLFNSAAVNAAGNAIGIMLTGMGEDGSMAMRKMKDVGSYNIVQDEKSSVVWGMPGKAVEYGAANIVVPLEDIAKELCKYFKKEL